MSVEKQRSVRILIADDEAEVRETYRKILVPSDEGRNADRFRELRSRLYEDKGAAASRPGMPVSAMGTVDAVFCDGAEPAVEAVRESLALGKPFAVAFLDMRMPPGQDGVWAATRIRELDPAIEIVICTAYSDVDAGEIAQLVQPEEKLSYIQKPFHPNEIRQSALSLASKWRAEHRIIKLAYFDTLTGLPNRVQSRNRLASAIAAARFSTWTSTISSGSTTPWVMAWGTNCSAWSPRDCRTRCGPAIPRAPAIPPRVRSPGTCRGWVGMNSSCCFRICTRPLTPPRWPPG